MCVQSSCLLALAAMHLKRDDDGELSGFETDICYGSDDVLKLDARRERVLVVHLWIQ